MNFKEFYQWAVSVSSRILFAVDIVVNLLTKTANNQQPTTNNQQPTTNNQQPSTDLYSFLSITILAIPKGYFC
jgi:hypothetical protein